MIIISKRTIPVKKSKEFEDQYGNKIKRKAHEREIEARPELDKETKERIKTGKARKINERIPLKTEDKERIEELYKQGHDIDEINSMLYNGKCRDNIYEVLYKPKKMKLFSHKGKVIAITRTSLPERRLKGDTSIKKYLYSHDLFLNKHDYELYKQGISNKRIASLPIYANNKLDSSNQLFNKIEAHKKLRKSEPEHA